MQNMKEAPIGVFDSGVGGLTVAREIMRQIPQERIVYFGDTARVPYGSKSTDTLIRYTRQIVRFLKTRGVKAIVVACNTASAVALEAVKDELDVVFGSKISDVAFRYCQPFDTVIVDDENGNEKREMYIMHFLHWLMVELKKYGAESKSAMDKHLAKYSK